MTENLAVDASPKPDSYERVLTANRPKRLLSRKVSSVSASKYADSIDHSLVDMDSPDLPKRANLGVENKNDGLTLNF